MSAFFKADLSLVVNKVIYSKSFTSSFLHFKILPNFSLHPYSVITKGEKEALANMQAYREKYGI